MVKNNGLKILPYFISVLMGLLMFWLSSQFTESNIQTILLSMTSTLLAIPLIFLSYEIIKKNSDKKLNSVVYDYAKWKVDRELFSIMAQLTKRVCKIGSEKEGENNLGFHDSLENLIKRIKGREFIGFQIFKGVHVGETELDKLLENPFILNKMGNEEIISIISIIKNLSKLSDMLQREDIFVSVGKKTNLYKIIHGEEMNPKNSILFPERYIILKKIDKGSGMVFDFGDYKHESLNKLLEYFIVNEKYLNDYCKIIFQIMRDIEKWCEKTGRKMIIDSKRFKLIKQS